MNIELAPIAIFTYKRIDTLTFTINALQNCDFASQSNVYIFSDGYKNHNDMNEVLTVRKYLKTIVGFKNIQLIFSASNKGLANSIIMGVSKVIVKH